MKGIVWNCRKVDWSYPDSGGRHNIEDCLLAYICCEKNDGIDQTKEVIRRIKQLNKRRYLKNNLVIFPFAHLSDQLLDDDQAKILIENIAVTLQKSMEVSIMGFNMRKEVKIHLLPENGDVSYFCY